PDALAGKASAQPRRSDESGGPSARWWRGQDLGRSPSGNAVGAADAWLQDAQQQADRQVHRESEKQVAASCELRAARVKRRLWREAQKKDRLSTRRCRPRSRT